MAGDRPLWTILITQLRYLLESIIELYLEKGEDLEEHDQCLSMFREYSIYLSFYLIAPRIPPGHFSCHVIRIEKLVAG